MVRLRRFISFCIYCWVGTILGDFISGCNMSSTNTPICFISYTQSGHTKTYHFVPPTTQGGLEVAPLAVKRTVRVVGMENVDLHSMILESPKTEYID